MIDHIGVSVRDLARSRAFYDAALAPLGYAVLAEFPGAIGMGRNPKPDLWLAEGPRLAATHIAIAADSRDAVAAFHVAALAAGGKDNGGPGLRAIYHPSYFGAFVLDPDGHNLEAVCHTPV
jgi:catechol 2,3-dioxygenase-like lactoylglutathione lyase family enzyme